MPKLLVVIDPAETEHSGLERCKETAPSGGTELHVASFVEVDHARDLAETIKRRREELAEIVRPFREIGYTVTEEVVPFSKLYESIIRVASECGADFVIKPMRQHSLARRIVLTSTDWNLIRFCPQPLLLVNATSEVRGRPVLAAIDVEDPDEQHAALNEVVLSTARAVAGVVDSPVHCVNSWHVNPTVMATGTVDPVPFQISRDMKADHVAKAHALGARYDIDEAYVSVEEGTPAFVIHETANEIGAGIVVIGTVARTGVSGLFVGNTAETVLEGSTTDVLVVKSPDFECPV